MPFGLSSSSSSSSHNFLEHVQKQRNLNLQQNQRQMDLVGSVAKLTSRIESAVKPSERLALKKERLKLQRELQNMHGPTLEEFDRKLLPFLQLCYKESGSTEKLQTMFDAEFQQSEDTNISYVPAEVEVCVRCKVNYIQIPSEAKLVCSGCGFTKPYMDTSVLTMAYGDEIEYSSFSYRRIGHFKELLNYLQAKETTPLPQKVLQKVMQRMVSMGVTKVEQITFGVVRRALRSLGLRKYYDHTMQIYCLVTGREPLRLEPQLEEKFLLMFKAIQQPWEKHKVHCREERKNFLSYPYCFYKISQLLGREDLLEYFTLLKCPKKRKDQEHVFYLICQDLGWPFIPI